MGSNASRSLRIYDTFLFDGELDLLEHRLRQNFDATDFFILIEAAETYRGLPKPLIFAENRTRFAWAAEKIRPVALQSLGPPDAGPRTRAAVQRNALLLALMDASEDDIVLLLDADEIPSRSLLERLRIQGLHEPHRLAMTRHYQRLDLLAPASTCCIDRSQPFAFASGHLTGQQWEPEPRWHGRSGVAVPMRCLRGTNGRTPYQWRFQTDIQATLPAGGRHLTAVDPSAQLSRKLKRVFHVEWSGERGVYPPHLARCEEHAVHHRGWWYAEPPAGDLPPDLVPLATACPETLRGRPLPPMWRRRCVRTWAWLRQLSLWTDAGVRRIDDHFERFLPFLAPLFLLLDAGRAAAAIVLRSFGAGVKDAAQEPSHAG